MVSTAPVSAFGDWPEVRLLLQKQDVDAGYHDTLQEILQQPETWLSTGNQMHTLAPKLIDLLQGVKAIVLTGSGSSEYAGESIRSALQKRMGTTTYAVGSGELLTDGTSLLPVERPALMVSFARSGDSPESIGALSMMLHDASPRPDDPTTCGDLQCGGASGEDVRI
jgi:tagatose-6-phosphate ketose/aldose isomerase